MKGTELSAHENLKITDTERMKRSQTGELVWPQTDIQLVDYLLRKLGMQSKINRGPRRGPVNPMPEGVGVFKFCMFKGKNNPVQALVDSGCDRWITDDGIPQNELVSCKLDAGPIPLSVASGMTINACAEWGSLMDHIKLSEVLLCRG